LQHREQIGDPLPVWADDVEMRRAVVREVQADLASAEHLDRRHPSNMGKLPSATANTLAQN
jgi:hypothetical protein